VQVAYIVIMHSKLGLALLFVAACSSSQADSGGSASTVDPKPTVTLGACPDTTLGETAQDCPWAAIARVLPTASDIDAVLAETAPALFEEMKSDAKHPALLDLWGRAINFNALAGGGFSTDPILAPAISDDLNALFGVAPRKDRVTHAGVQHTYGYLFSVLQTPFGYKRARWVDGSVNAGFGLPAGTLGPMPNDGTLFGNATYLAGEIAFSGEPETKTLAATTDGVSTSIQKLDVTTLKVTRLTEVAPIDDVRTVTIRTDFVQFPTVDPATAPATANTYWLVYSIHDSEDDRSRLITAFPITTGSFHNYTAATLMGDMKNVTTAYNAWVDGLSGLTKVGSRKLESVTLTRLP
jgi:hypothetical protein